MSDSNLRPAFGSILILISVGVEDKQKKGYTPYI